MKGSKVSRTTSSTLHDYTTHLQAAQVATVHAAASVAAIAAAITALLCSGRDSGGGSGDCSGGRRRAY